jgi:hypothetical protein
MDQKEHEEVAPFIKREEDIENLDLDSLSISNIFHNDSLHHKDQTNLRTRSEATSVRLSLRIRWKINRWTKLFEDIDRWISELDIHKDVEHAAQASQLDAGQTDLSSGMLDDIGQWASGAGEQIGTYAGSRQPSDGAKRKARSNRGFEKRQRRDKEDDGFPTSLPNPAEWKADDIEGKGFPCIYYVFYPTKFPECPVTKLWQTIAHYL